MRSGAVRVNVCFEAFSGLFGVFDDSPEDPTMRSSKELPEGTQRMRAEWIKSRKVGDVRLVEPLAGRDGASRGHFLAISPRTEPTSSETYSKNLNTLNQSICTLPSPRSSPRFFRRPPRVPQRARRTRRRTPHHHHIPLQPGQVLSSAR